MTDEEQRICAQYSARDSQGFVHCHECPLVILRWDRDCYCKAVQDQEEERRRNHE